MSTRLPGGQRRSLWRVSGCLLAIVVVLGTALVSLYLLTRLIGSWVLESKMGSYMPVSNDELVAQISIPDTNTNHELHILITVYDSSGNVISIPKSFYLHCDQLGLAANIINIKPGFALGVPPAWFQLTNIEGRNCYDKHGKFTSSLQKQFDGSDLSLAKVAQSGGYWGLLDSMGITSNLIKPDGKIYHAYITQTSLMLNAVSNS